MLYAEGGVQDPGLRIRLRLLVRLLGELPAYLVGWALILEYGVAGAATSVGWGEYFDSFIKDAFGWEIPHALNVGAPADDPGIVNLPAVVLVGMCCLLLLRGPRSRPAPTRSW